MSLLRNVTEHLHNAAQCTSAAVLLFGPYVRDKSRMQPEIAETKVCHRHRVLGFLYRCWRLGKKECLGTVSQAWAAPLLDQTQGSRAFIQHGESFSIFRLRGPGARDSSEPLGTERKRKYLISIWESSAPLKI